MRRLGAALVAGALTVGLLATAPSASAARKPVPAGKSATWLGKQLTKGVVHNDEFDYDDLGLTADVGFALAAIRGNSPSLRKVRNALRKNVDSWTTGVDFGSSDVYAGSTAKALVFAQTVGANPRKFGGTNLVKQLRKLVSKAGPNRGRIQDASTSGDFANTIGQAYAAAGLANAGDKNRRPVLRFLLKQQCKRGFFRLTFSDKSLPNQKCDAAPTPADRAPDTDATAIAVLQLLSLERPSPKARKAVTKALKWLRRTQKGNGSFGGGPSTEGPNANSTGLAAWALASAGRCQQAGQAARWIAKLTVSGKVGGTPLAGEKGAIAYDRAALKAAQVSGITSATRDQFRRATAQASPALLFQSGRGCPG